MCVLYIYLYYLFFEVGNEIVLNSFFNVYVYLRKHHPNKVTLIVTQEIREGINTTQV